jgi:hypothetical protein
LKTKDLHQFGEVLPGRLRVFDNEDLSRFHFISSALPVLLSSRWSGRDLLALRVLRGLTSYLWGYTASQAARLLVTRNCASQDREVWPSLSGKSNGVRR